ncbi:hypothetical protein ACN47E_000701 [Coniothyrium glycines]
MPMVTGLPRTKNDKTELTEHLQFNVHGALDALQKRIWNLPSTGRRQGRGPEYQHLIPFRINPDHSTNITGDYHAVELLIDMELQNLGKKSITQEEPPASSPHGHGLISFGHGKAGRRLSKPIGPESKYD